MYRTRDEKKGQTATKKEPYISFFSSYSINQERKNGSLMEK